MTRFQLNFAILQCSPNCKTIEIRICPKQKKSNQKVAASEVLRFLGNSLQYEKKHLDL